MGSLPLPHINWWILQPSTGAVSVLFPSKKLNRSRPERFAALMEHVPATGLDALAMTVPIQKNDGAEGLRKPVFF